MIISERIFEIMKKQKMSQRELSRRTGITISTISDWNTKKSNPASDKLLVISEALGVSVEELLIGSESFEEKMDRLTSELSEMFVKSHELEGEIRKKLGAIGYEI